MRARLTPGLIAATEARAAALDIGAERVLVTSRQITEDSYVIALAASLRLPFEPLEHVPREDCPLADEAFNQADLTGLMPLLADGRPVWVMAPLVHSAQRIIELVASRPDFDPHIRLTTTARLRNFIMRHGSAALGVRAADDLRTTDPLLSAGTRGPPRGLVWVALAGSLLLAAMFAPRALIAGTGTLLSMVFFGWTLLRLIGATTRWRRWERRAIPPHALPAYTVIVALYDEANGAADLIRALDRLDYPPEKLQIIIALEPGDHATQSAFARLNFAGRYEVVIAPDVGPRTKPKALNAALAFARGRFVAVYDAEDRPAPDQLHRALDVFLSGDDAIACVQARLSIDNTRDGWLTGMFTAEYAGLFDVLLPGLAQRGLPLPLGGSSNHFRTAVLRQVGGWDPYNVTEDADLGMRLARFGYRTTVIDSTTLEEAPNRLRHWLPQRTRWFKGWLQTWAVHMREPLRLARDLGPGGFATFQLVVGGTVLAALVHPVFLCALLYTLAAHGSNALLGLYGASILAGYAASTVLGLIGLARRGLLSQSFVLILTPVHWLLLSLAAWRALFQLLRDPYRWEKTTHGLARTSRSVEDTLAPEPRNSAAGRLQPLRADA